MLNVHTYPSPREQVLSAGFADPTVDNLLRLAVAIVERRPENGFTEAILRPNVILEVDVHYLPMSVEGVSVEEVGKGCL